MALITNSTKRSIDLIVPFTLAGWVFYDAYAKKGIKDWKPALIMSLIVLAAAYLVTTQVTRLMDDKE